jgi:hypothetical protein
LPGDWTTFEASGSLWLPALRLVDRSAQSSHPAVSTFYALRGHAGQPGPRAENRERGKRRRDGNRAIAFPLVASSENASKRQKNKLAYSIANGKSISEWAKTNNVPRRTAYRWSSAPEVRTKVEWFRRRALDRAIGTMSGSVNWAALEITKLAKVAVSESVKLTALRTIFSNMMAVTEFAELKDRMVQIEEQLNDRERACDTGQAV